MLCFNVHFEALFCYLFCRSRFINGKSNGTITESKQPGLSEQKYLYYFGYNEFTETFFYGRVWGK